MSAHKLSGRVIAASVRVRLGADFLHMFSVGHFKRRLLSTYIGDAPARTELGYKVDPKLRELATHGHREPGGVIHAT